MVKHSRQSLDSTFAVLASPTRRAILAHLSRHNATVSELAAPFDMSLPAVSKHLRVLIRAGLLAQERDGRLRRCQLKAKPLREAAKWIATYRRFWDRQFDSLAEYLEETQNDSNGEETT